MGQVKFGDVVKEVKINIDRTNNPYEYYVAGDHMDSEDLTIRRKGSFATDDVGPAFTRLFKPGQILYGSRRTYLKKVAVADFEGICSNTTFVLETKDESILRQRLLPFIMLTDDFTKWSISKSKGSTNPYILFSDLANYEFELPDITRQDELVELLWQAYATKESYKNMILAIDEMVKSQFIEMFKDAPRKNLGDLASFINGSAFKPEEWSLSGLPIVRIQNLTQENASFNYYDGDSCSKIRITKGDVLVSWSATLGVFTWDKGDALLNQHIFKVVFDKEDIDKEFFIHTVKTALETMGQFAHGSTMRHVVKKDFDETQVAFPSKEEQVSFSNIVKQADKSKYLN